jgi:hypothetical protein
MVAYTAVEIRFGAGVGDNREENPLPPAAYLSKRPKPLEFFNSPPVLRLPQKPLF